MSRRVGSALSRAGALAAALDGRVHPVLGLARRSDGTRGADRRADGVRSGGDRSDGPRRALGALATVATCPVTRHGRLRRVFGTHGLGRARRRSPALFGIALIPLAGPIFWMVGGALSHGDALFFTARVAAYRDALGGSSSPLCRACSATPGCIVRCEPESCSLAAIGVAGALACRGGAFMATGVRARYSAACSRSSCSVKRSGGGAHASPRTRGAVDLVLRGDRRRRYSAARSSDDCPAAIASGSRSARRRVILAGLGRPAALRAA